MEYDVPFFTTTNKSLNKVVEEEASIFPHESMTHCELHYQYIQDMEYNQLNRQDYNLNGLEPFFQSFYNCNQISNQDTLIYAYKKMAEITETNKVKTTFFYYLINGFYTKARIFMHKNMWNSDECYYLYLCLKFMLSSNEKKVIYNIVFKKLIDFLKKCEFEEGSFERKHSKLSSIFEYLSFIYDTMNNQTIDEFMEIESLPYIQNIHFDFCQENIDTMENIYEFLTIFHKIKFTYNFIYYISMGIDTKEKNFKNDFIKRYILCIDEIINIMNYCGIYSCKHESKTSKKHKKIKEFFMSFYGIITFDEISKYLLKYLDLKQCQGRCHIDLDLNQNKYEIKVDISIYLDFFIFKKESTKIWNIITDEFYTIKYIFKPILDWTQKILFYQQCQYSLIDKELWDDFKMFHKNVSDNVPYNMDDILFIEEIFSSIVYEL